MSNDNNGTVKVDEYAAMLIFGHSDWRESLGETGLDGDECQKYFNGDEPTGAEIKDPVSEFFAAASLNRFEANPSHVSAEARARDERFSKRFNTTPEGRPLAKRWADNDPFALAIQKAARMRKEGRMMKLFDANGVLLAEKEIAE
jgi:hypothetical protein